MKYVSVMLVAGYVLTGCAYVTPPLENPIIEQHAQGRINTFAVIPSRRIVIMKSENPANSGEPPEKQIIICAEAPADVTDNLAGTFAASLAASTKAADVSAGISKSIETFGKFLFQRTQGIQLFRDRSYYLCQARMNGFITSEQYFEQLNQAFKDTIPLIEKELQSLQRNQPGETQEQRKKLEVPTTSAKAGGAFASTDNKGNTSAEVPSKSPKAE
jgi:hypothetical protein